MPVDEVLDAARARQGRRRHAASAWAPPGARSRTARRSTRVLRHGARRARARHGGVRARSGMLDAEPGAAPGRGRPDRLQPQPRHLARVLRRDHLARARTTIACETLEHVRKAGIIVCCGGIIGMGESLDDRCGMLLTLANLDPQPESVPINALVPVAGTPLADRPPVDPLELVRMIATARILMPKRARAPLGGPRWRCSARRRCCASSPAPTRSSTARSCSPRRTPTTTKTSRCCESAGLRAE